MSGWIKLHRKLKEWEWSNDPLTLSTFIHMLIEANFTEGSYKGHKIGVGQFPFGRKAWSTKLGMSEQSLRTVLKRLEKSNEITIKSTNKFSVITVNNYNLYQDINQQDNQQLTNNQPTTNHTIRIKNKEEENKETILDDEFNKFWKQTKFPKRKQDAKGDVKKKFIKLIKNEKLTYEEILKASNNFAIKHEGDNWSIGMRRFLDSKENIDPYLHNTELALEEKEKEQRLAYEATLQEIEY